MWRLSQQSSGDNSGGEHDDLVARLAAVPRPSAMPTDMEERVRTRLTSALAPPVHAPFGGLSGGAAAGGILGGLPFATQAIVAALLLSVAGWLVVRDVQAYSSPYFPFPSAYTVSAGSGIDECAPLVPLPRRHHSGMASEAGKRVLRKAPSPCPSPAAGEGGR